MELTGEDLATHIASIPWVEPRGIHAAIQAVADTVNPGLSTLAEARQRSYQAAVDLVMPPKRKSGSILQRYPSKRIQSVGYGLSAGTKSYLAPVPSAAPSVVVVAAPDAPLKLRQYLKRSRRGSQRRRFAGRRRTTRPARRFRRRYGRKTTGRRRKY